MNLTHLSLRWRVALWSMLTTGIVLLGFGLGTLFVLYHEQVEGIDAAIDGEARFLQAQTHNGADASDPEELASAFPKWIDIAVYESDGRLLSRSPELPEDVAHPALRHRRLHTVYKHGHFWRIRSVAMGSRHVVLAHNLADAGDTVEDLSSAYLVSFPFALILAACAGWWVAARGLRPVVRLTRSAENISAEKLSTRLPIPQSGDEIARLASALNELLDRLERSFNQAQWFAADASHELRTPLTIMRGEIEEALRAGGLAPDQEKRLVSLLEETARLDRISEHLLLLARFDAGQGLLEPRPLDFSALVSETSEDASLLGSALSLTLETDIHPDLWIQGDTAHLKRLLLNLFDNASKFNIPGGRIRCTLEKNQNRAVLWVGNSGPGIVEKNRERLFERFFQSSNTGGAANRGHGLGLSLCREIARAHGGEIRLSKTTREWTEFGIEIPLIPPPSER